MLWTLQRNGCGDEWAPNLAPDTATFPLETASRFAWWYGLGLLLFQLSWETDCASVPAVVRSYG